MSNIDFLLFTAAAGVAFGFALLWVITQWLRADQQSGAIEHDLQRSVERLRRQAAEAQAAVGPQFRRVTFGVDAAEPETAHVVAAEASAARTGAALPSEKRAEHEEAELSAEEEMELVFGRLLFVWGSVGTLLGMALGWVLYESHPAALGGAVVGSVVGVLGGSAMAALKR